MNYYIGNWYNFQCHITTSIAPLQRKSLLCPISTDTFKCELEMSLENDQTYLYVAHIYVSQIAKG